MDCLSVRVTSFLFTVLSYVVHFEDVCLIDLMLLSYLNLIPLTYFCSAYLFSYSVVILQHREAWQTEMT